jgi:hypothetical protein
MSLDGVVVGLPKKSTWEGCCGYTGRMYAPMADMMTRLEGGAVQAITKGQTIIFGANGAIQIFSRATGSLIFNKPGGIP